MLFIMTLINLVVLWNFISNGKVLHGIGYFLFFYFSIAVIYVFTHKIPPKHEIEIKEAKKELTLAIIFAVLGLLFLTLNFMMKSNEIPNHLLIKLPIILGTFVFAMPLGIFIYLWIKKYRFLNLGLKTQPLSSLWLGFLIWGSTGIFAYFFNREGILWARAYEELGGVLGMIVQGLIAAALFEEFSRFVLQSRFERVFKSAGAPILFATTIWSFMHFPVTYYKGAGISDTLKYCLQIIPIGFIWGYMIHRTKSILPSTITHGMNFWGFQNA